MAELITFKIETEVTLDIATLAKAFCALDDDQQAKFFVEVAKVASEWDSPDPLGQFYRVGSHLRNCECATEGAREIVRQMINGLTTGTR